MVESSIASSCAATYFYIPNSFLPNNDQINDYFEMFNIPEPYVLMVFDRWGNKGSGPSKASAS